MEIGKPCKTLYILANKLGDPNFLLHKSDQHARIKLSAKLKNILHSGFRATLNFQLFKVALNLLCIILFNLYEQLQ